MRLAARRQLPQRSRLQQHPQYAAQGAEAGLSGAGGRSCLSADREVFQDGRAFPGEQRAAAGPAGDLADGPVLCGGCPDKLVSRTSVRTPERFGGRPRHLAAICAHSSAGAIAETRKGVVACADLPDQEITFASGSASSWSIRTLSSANISGAKRFRGGLLRVTDR